VGTEGQEKEESPQAVGVNRRMFMLRFEFL